MSPEHSFSEGGPQRTAAFQQYLEIHEAIGTHETFEATYIPPQLGGSEGSQSVLWDESGTPRDVASILRAALTNESNLRQLRARCDAQADTNIPAVVYETHMHVRDAARKNWQIKRIFVPEVVSGDAPRYMSRLARVAQEVGLPVIVPVQSMRTTMYETINPPYADSVDDYWRLSPFNERQPALSDDAPQALQGFLEAFSAGTEEILPMLSQLAQQSEGALQRAFAAAKTPEKGVGADVVPILSAYAASDGLHVSREIRSQARMVLTKIRDRGCLRTMSSELEAICRGNATGHEIVHYLGYYLRDSLDGFSILQGRAESILPSDLPSARLELQAILNIMAHADAVQASDFMSWLIDEAEAYPTALRTAAATRALDILPDTMARARESVLSNVRTQTLLESERRVARLLTALLDGQPSFMQPMQWDSPPHITVARSLLESKNQACHQPLMKRYIMWLFNECGSLITEPLFATTYCRYRRAYPDVPEISSRIYPAP